MGILKSLFTLGKSVLSQAEESIEEAQGVRMLEQHIRDAKGELDKAEMCIRDSSKAVQSFLTELDNYTLADLVEENQPLYKLLLVE